MATLKINDTQRCDRHFLLDAFAILLVTPLGAAGESLRADRQLRTSTAKQRLFLDLFGLTLSQGPLMSMCQRTAPAFEEKRGQALALLRQAAHVASDESGVRIEAVNGYYWVFRCKRAVVHKTAFSRSAEVVLDHGRRAPQGVDLRSLQRPAKPRRRPADLSRPSFPRHRLWLGASQHNAVFRLKLWFARTSPSPNT